MKASAPGIAAGGVSHRATAAEDTISAGPATATFKRSKDRVSPKLRRRMLFPLVVLLLLLLLASSLVFSTASAPAAMPERRTVSPSTTRSAVPSAPAAEGSCSPTEESLFGLPVEQLAANIRRSYERFNSVEVDQALRRERGPPSYVYGGSAARHPEDSIRTVKAKFFSWCSKVNAFTRLSSLTAALSGFRLECVGGGWSRFTFITYFGPTVGYLLASENRSYFENMLDQLNDEDVVTFADSDLVYSGDADMYNVVRTFASVTAHSAAEHERMTTRDPREAADSARWTRYTRDVRTGSALAPFIVNGEDNCYLVGMANKCLEYFDEISALHSAFLRQQEYYREHRGGGNASAGGDKGDYAAASAGTSTMIYFNTGFFLARVWALRRALLAAQNLVYTLPNCRVGECTYPIPGSPNHRHGAHRKDTNDQALIGLLYLRSRLHEYRSDGPLAVEYSSGDTEASGAAAALLTPQQRAVALKVASDYDPALEFSFIRSGAPHSDGASRLLPDGLLMMDSHTVFSYVILRRSTRGRSARTFLSNASYPPQAHHAAANYRALRPYDEAMARRFEERRRHTIQGGFSVAAASGPLRPSPLACSPLGNLLNEHVLILSPKKHTFACRADEAEAKGTCSSLSFLRAASLITADSPITFPPQSDLVGTRPLSWHFAGEKKRTTLPYYLYLLPQLYPLLHPLANHTRAASELGRLTELLPPLRVWPLVGECGEVDAYRGGEGTGRAVTEELIRRSTRELGCLPAAAPDLVPLGDSGKEAELLWAAAGRR